MDYSKAPAKPLTSRPPYVRSQEKRELVGVDVFVEFTGVPEALAKKLAGVAGDGMVFEMLSNRGMKVWPGGMEETSTVDIYRCRFQIPDEAPGPVSNRSVTALLDRVTDAGVEFVKMEGLFNFDGKPGFSKVQGQ